MNFIHMILQFFFLRKLKSTFTALVGFQMYLFQPCVRVRSRFICKLGMKPHFHFFFHHQLVDRNFQRMDIFEHVAIKVKHIVEIFIRCFGDFEIRGNTKARFFYKIDCRPVFYSKCYWVKIVVILRIFLVLSKGNSLIPCSNLPLLMNF